jgi:hypothetical protein
MANDKRPIPLLTMVAHAPRKSKRLARLVCFLAAAVLSSNSPAVSADESRDRDDTPILLSTQGSFLVGGNVVTNPGTFDPITLAPDGQTIHGDHAYAQFQIPEHARRYPLVMWHGGGQFSKTWEPLSTAETATKIFSCGAALLHTS